MIEKDWYNLCHAVETRDYQCADALLVSQPSLRNAKNRTGETVLHFLAIENNMDGVLWLHGKGFSLDERNVFGTPIIFEVAQLGYRDLFDWFLHHGADVSATDPEGNGILEHLLEFEQQEMADWVDRKMRNLALMKGGADRRSP